MLTFFKNNTMGIIPTMIYICLILYTLFVLFHSLYRKLNLEISLTAIICFYINVFMFTMFISSFILGLTYKKPIYLENLSLFSQYKYLIFTIIVFLLIILFLIDKIYTFNRDNLFISFVTYPYLKKQINNILDCFVESHLSEIYESVFEKVYKNKFYNVLFFLIHFIFVHSIRIINTFIFLNFVLFHGDLRTIFLLIPLTLFAWLLQNLEYHFITYIETVSEETKRLFSVSLPEQEYSSINSVTFSPKNLNISLTEYGEAKGLHIDNLIQYRDQWILLMNFKYKFSRYKNKCSIIDKANIMIRIICWVAITKYFFV